MCVWDMYSVMTLYSGQLKDGHFWQKWPFSDHKKLHFELPNQNSKTTLIVQTFPKYGFYDCACCVQHHADQEKERHLPFHLHGGLTKKSECHAVISIYWLFALQCHWKQKSRATAQELAMWWRYRSWSLPKPTFDFGLGKIIVGLKHYLIPYLREGCG